MRRYIIPVAGVLLMPATGFTQDMGGGLLYAQAKPMAAPTKPMTAPSAPAASQEMKKFLVFFDWDKATLTSEARRIIANAAEDFKKTGSTRIVATGHTDTSGSAQYNMGLSIRRAEAVKAELVRLGVPATSITTIGRGQEDLLVPTKDGVREPQNRRVSIEFPVPVVAKPAPPAPAPVAAPPPPPPAPEPLKWAVTLGPWYGYNLKEVDGGGNDKSSNLVGADLGLSFYPTPEVPITVSQQGFNTVGTSQDDGWGGRSTLGVGYEAPTGTVKPYVGIYGGGVYGKGVQDGFIAGPELGMKFDFTRNWFGYAKAAYDFQFRNDWDEGIPNGGLGAGYRF
jgi:outer membrane protein OmpA-like peptidoglycan-associated protein